MQHTTRVQVFRRTPYLRVCGLVGELARRLNVQLVHPNAFNKQVGAVLVPEHHPGWGGRSDSIRKKRKQR